MAGAYTCGMRVPAAFVLAAAMISWAAPARAEVQLRIENGLVSLKATNATVREILAEWGRVGSTKIVNGERMPGGPVTLELTGVTEEEALEIILRSAAGYVTAPRAVAQVNASRYDRILVMPTSSPTRPAPSPQPGSFQQPARSRSFRRNFRRSSRADSFRRSRADSSSGQSGRTVSGAVPARQFPPQRPVNDDGDADVQDDPAPNVVLPNGAPSIPRRAAPQQQQPPDHRAVRRQPSAGGAIAGRRVSSGHGRAGAAAAATAAGSARSVAGTARTLSGADRRSERGDRRRDAAAGRAAAERAEDAEGGVDEPRGRESRARSTTPSRARWSPRSSSSGAIPSNSSRKAAGRISSTRRPPKSPCSRQYLPPAADPAVVERAVADAIAETGAASSKDMGRVMKAAMARLTGQTVDGRVVNELVRKKLAGA